MKLYTEEQVREAVKMARSSYNIFTTAITLMYDQIEILEKLTPIELPSDEERINKFNSFISTEVSLEFLTKEQGERLKWYYETYLVNEIQGGNK